MHCRIVVGRLERSRLDPVRYRNRTEAELNQYEDILLLTADGTHLGLAIVGVPGLALAYKPNAGERVKLGILHSHQQQRYCREIGRPWLTHVAANIIALNKRKE